MTFDLFTYLSSLAFIYVYGRLTIHYVPGILGYFLNKPFFWKKEIERPRILFHVVGLGLMHLMIIQPISMTDENLGFQLIKYFILIMGFMFCYMSWTNQFKYSFQQGKKLDSFKFSRNFNLSISDTHIQQLYDELIRYDLIDQDFTTLHDFRNVLLKDWNSHNSKIKLNLDGPSCRAFYDFFIRTFPNNSMSLKNLFVTSGLILRPDGRRYNYNTLKNAPIRTTISKQHGVLEKIFKLIQSKS